MVKIDWKAKASALKKWIKSLSGGSEAGKAQVAALISPLAPKDGFPILPKIKGAAFCSIEAGVRYKNRKDVMLVRLAPGTTVAGVFTKSATRAACILDAQAKLAKGAGKIRQGAAIVVNSGNSNAFTGRAGVQSVDAISQSVATALDLPVERVFSSSTGVIGEVLPHDRIVAVVADLAAGLSEGTISQAAQAIMTTDTFPKGASAVIAGDEYFTADAQFHPNTFPFRDNPGRDSRYLNIFDASAPHRLVVEPIPADLRRSARQKDYLESDGVDLRAVPDVDVSPDNFCVFTGTPLTLLASPSCTRMTLFYTPTVQTLRPGRKRWLPSMLHNGSWPNSRKRIRLLSIRSSPLCRAARRQRCARAFSSLVLY